MRKLAAIFAITSIVLVGCGSSATDKPSAEVGTTTGDATGSGRMTATASLAGEWKGKVKPADSKEGDIGSKMAEGLADLLDLTLEVQADGNYTMTAFILPITGKLTRTGDDVTLTPEKIMGQTPEEYKKTAPKNQNGMASEPDMKPQMGKVSADGQTITLKDAKGGEMIFERIPAKKIGPSSVTADEAKYAGNYKGVVDKSKLKPDDKASAGMEPFLKLALEVDNTFVMKVGMAMEGKWKLEGDKITLTPNDKGFKGPDGKDPQFQITGDKLVPIGASMPFHFVKE